MMFCKAACVPSNPATDAVKVNLAELVQKDGLLEEKQREEEERLEEKQREEEERQKEEEGERAKLEEKSRLEEQRRLKEELERRRREEEDKLQLEQQEKDRMRCEEEARARARREAEEQQQREATERQEALQRFLAQHGFSGVNDPRKSKRAVLGATTTYPLHFAAELGDARAVELLLKAGAKLSQTNSSGKTALQAAQKKSKAGSHDAVLRLLAGNSPQPPVRGA